MSDTTALSDGINTEMGDMRVKEDNHCYGEVSTGRAANFLRHWKEFFIQMFKLPPRITGPTA
jgi:hypothetical protein